MNAQAGGYLSYDLFVSQGDSRIALDQQCAGAGRAGGPMI